MGMNYGNGFEHNPTRKKNHLQKGFKLKVTQLITPIHHVKLKATKRGWIENQAIFSFHHHKWLTKNISKL